MAYEEEAFVASTCVRLTQPITITFVSRRNKKDKKNRGYGIRGRSFLPSTCVRLTQSVKIQIVSSKN
jgi:hypothetical protein